MALPILNWCEKKWPDSYKYWQIAQKCSQAAPIYLNHPMIDQIVISDGLEGLGPRDLEIAAKCDVKFNIMPSHPEGDSWPNRRNIFEETWVMAGLPLEEYYKLTPEEQRPKLKKWFQTEKQPAKTLALWPCAGYGKENTRNPSYQWYMDFIKNLQKKGYVIYQFGHPRDYNFDIWTSPQFRDHRSLPFFEQIKMSLGCDLVIGTDSGAGLIIGAYEHPQISLLTNHWPGHVTNFTAFATNNPKNVNFFAENDASNINAEEVYKKITELC